MSNIDFYGFNVEANREAVDKVIEIDEKIRNENPKGSARTKLMFEQLLRGLYINQF